MELTTRLAELKSSIPKDDWKYFHLESIENFIYHLPSIANERTRARTAEAIGDYLDVVRKRSSEPFDRKQTYKELFGTHIWSLSHVFTDDLNFIMKPDYLVFSFLMLILGFVLFLTLPLWTAAAALIAVIGWKVLRDRVKVRQRKFY